MADLAAMKRAIKIATDWALEKESWTEPTRTDGTDEAYIQRNDGNKTRIEHRASYYMKRLIQKNQS